MALQGNLRDFSATEILQLLGTQRKTGCLSLEQEGRRMAIFVQDGRVVSTRTPGLAQDDPLLAFLRGAHRLSDEQQRGILTIQRESGRDLEDLLLNGRYLEAGELAGYVERQILDDLMRLSRWEEGSYRFDPHLRWPHTPLARLSIEAILVEVARRADEQKHYSGIFPDPYALLGVRDLPDPNVDLTEEERELFGIVDGQHTVSEVLAAAPLSEYETYEAMQRMVEAGWIEIAGRRDPALESSARVAQETARPVRRAWGRDLAIVAAVMAAVVVLRTASHLVTPDSGRPSAADVYAAAQVRDVRMALDLYRREHGVYPAHLEDLLEARWVASGQLRIAGHVLRYRSQRDGLDYRLDLTPDR